MNNTNKPYSAEAVKHMNDMFKEKYGETLWLKTVEKMNHNN